MSRPNVYRVYLKYFYQKGKNFINILDHFEDINGENLFVKCAKNEWFISGLAITAQ
jgi:hypothetical protein